MQTESNHPTSPDAFLRTQFLNRKQGNPRYSIASYAKHLGVSRSFLSRLLSGERPLTVSLVVQMGAVFQLPTSTVEDWISFVIAHSNKNSKISKAVREKFQKSSDLKAAHPIHHYGLERFKTISQWHHFAILSLTHLKKFNPDPKWISKQLGITSVEARDAINRLLDLGLLERKAGTLKQTKNMLFVDQTRADPAVSQYHQQMCDKAKLAVSDTSQNAFESQYFSGVTLAFDRKRMPEFKKKLQTIAKEMMRSTLGGDHEDLYQLNIQLFPLTGNKGNS